MSHELFYTSAPRGLNPGARGYCIVAMTKGMPTFLAERLEDLSGYKPLFAALDPRNPVNLAHYCLDLGQQSYHVLSRIAPAGLDYSNRNNKFAHHVVLTPEELPPGGPAWLLLQPGFMEHAWDQGEPRWLPSGRKPPRGDMAIRPCKLWHHAAGDAGWAGILAETVLGPTPRPAVILHDPGVDLLALFAEALALLPAKERWKVSFSTYAASVSVGEGCLWRGLVKNSAEAKERAHFQGALVLTLGSLGAPSPGPLVESARTGKMAKFPVYVAPTPAPKKASYNPGEATAPDSLQPQVSLASLHQGTKTKASHSTGELEAAVPPASTKSMVLGVVLGLALTLLLTFCGELFSGGALADLGGRTTRNQLKVELEGKEIDLINSKKDLDEKNISLVSAEDAKLKLRGEINSLTSQLSSGQKTALEEMKKLAKVEKDLEEHKMQLEALDKSLKALQGQFQELEKTFKKTPTEAPNDAGLLWFKKDFEKMKKGVLLAKLPGKGKHTLNLVLTDLVKDNGNNVFEWPDAKNVKKSAGKMTFEVGEAGLSFHLEAQDYPKALAVFQKNTSVIWLTDADMKKYPYEPKIEK